MSEYFTDEQIELLKQKFEICKKTQLYIDRKKQRIFASIAGKIILSVLENDEVSAKAIEGWIHLFAAGKEPSVDYVNKYLSKFVKSDSKREEIEKAFFSTKYRGYTAVGKAGLTKINDYVPKIKEFLLNINSSNSKEDIKKEVERYESLNIPEVKEGIYSPWIHYLKPELCPIVNSALDGFLKEMGLKNYKGKYLPLMDILYEIEDIFNLEDFGMVDAFVSNQEVWNNQAIGETELSDNENRIEEYKQLLLNTHNLILHGAPGTGKTYLAKQIAEAMGCEDNEIGFVQFHPSYDYTDFVEGLRPVNNGDNGQIGFERKDGVFKKFCEKAVLSNSTDNDILEELNDNPTVWKVSLEGTGDNPTRTDCMKNGYIRLGWSNYGEVVDFSNFDGYDKTGGSVVLVAFQSKMKIGDIVLSCWSATEIDAIGIVTGEYEYRADGGDYPRYRTVKWLVKGIRENIVEKNRGKTLTLASVYRLSISIQDVIEIVSKYNTAISSPEKDFVFIIDEINRGEMSKIFGELFFSIDPGYRGKKGQIKTQYQNLVQENNIFYDGFYIPENVYIIGTMNDIDRSVESMDFAFRRRFTFKEIKANENLGMLDELDESIRDKAKKKLLCLNDAIWNEKTKSGIEGLSSAYHIGGAYFLKLKELGNDFGKLWEYHLEGLLREYLRGMEDAERLLETLKEAFDNPKTGTDSVSDEEEQNS